MTTPSIPDPLAPMPGGGVPHSGVGEGGPTAPNTIAPCSLLLEVFDPASLEEPDPQTIAWNVSTDPTHARPFLLAPRNYAEQEIDPITGSASIGTVEVGVIDVRVFPNDQASGWMTARVHGMLGRRCRLRRWINSTEGWQTIADGPAGAPRMDSSYAAYRWPIRDTREIERKSTAFNLGGSASIIPRGAVYGFGRYFDDEDYEEKFLLWPTLGTPLRGNYVLVIAENFSEATVNLVTHGSFDPLAARVDKDGLKAVESVEYAPDRRKARYADALWRVVGQTDWNISHRIAVSTAEFGEDEDGETITSIVSVTLFQEDFGIPEGFPTEGGAEIEIIVRYRGPASDAFPYYVEGTLGEVLTALYTGKYTLPLMDGIEGSVYDPENLGSLGAGFGMPIQFDPDALADMTQRVLLRQTEPVADIRAWAESTLFSPSGWMPTLDNDMRISPRSRSLPLNINPLNVLNNDVVVPSPDWQHGPRTVSQVSYTYPRFFIPLPESGFQTKPDGLAIRDVVIGFNDRDSELQYGPQIVEYDAAAFGAVGTEEGFNIPGNLESGSELAQEAKFAVLDRYRAGVQTIAVIVRRNRIPRVRVGDWVPWNLMHLPDRVTGFRGSTAEAAQIVSLRDDDCTWRSLVLEEAELASAPPGYADPLRVIDDDADPGYGTLEILSDTEG